MGINYYVITEARKLHFAKISSGWPVLFRGYPDLKLTSLADWIDLIKREEASILNEDGKYLSLCEFLYLATVRRAGPVHQCAISDEQGFQFLTSEFS